jgi:hypothetical protein
MRAAPRRCTRGGRTRRDSNSRPLPLERMGEIGASRTILAADRAPLGYQSTSSSCISAYDLLRLPGRRSTVGRPRHGARPARRGHRHGAFDGQPAILIHSDAHRCAQRHQCCPRGGCWVILRMRRRSPRTMGVVVDPVARGRNPFSCGDRGGVADDGDQVTMATRLDPENAKAILGIVERNSFDKARQDFLS